MGSQLMQKEQHVVVDQPPLDARQRRRVDGAEPVGIVRIVEVG